MRASIGLAGQYAAVDENLTAAENLRLVGRLTHATEVRIKERTAALLERFDLVHADNRLVRTYSGGMRRRLDLAAALVHEPPVLFLDEPTTGLDPQGRTELWTVIEDLVSGGTTVLLTTQYLEEADRLADNIVVIDHGAVIAEGTAAQLKSRLGETVIELGFGDDESVRTASRAACTRRSGRGRGSRAPGQRRRRPDRDARDRPQRSTGPSSLPITMALREPTLDDVFLELTGHTAEEPVEPDGETATGEEAPTRAEGLMTTATAPTSLELREDAPRPVSDALTMAWRNLLNIRRNPQLLVFATIQPVIFVLMFRYVFGGAIAASWNGQPVPYVDFLMPGIFVQTVTFGALTTGVGLAEDLQKGLIDRFRSLPIARSAVLVGRTWADLVRNLFVVMLMAIVGFLVGWRINTNVVGLLAALGARARVRVLALVAVRDRRALGSRRGDRAGRVVPDPRPARVRVVRVRARRARCRAGSRCSRSTSPSPPSATRCAR